MGARSTMGAREDAAVAAATEFCKSTVASIRTKKIIQFSPLAETKMEKLEIK